MRKKILGAIAALTAGVGGASAQAPARPVAPQPVGTVGSFDGGMKDPNVRPANAERYNPGVPPPLPGGGGPGLGGPGGGVPDGPDPMMGVGGPVYPPPGTYGQLPGDQPVLDGAFNAATPARFFVSGQYLLLFPEGQPARFPLLTTSAPADFGRLGNATTTVLAGGSNDLNVGTVSGFRIDAGLWRAGDQRVGVEVGGLYQSPYSYDRFVRSSDQGIPLLARPFTTPAGVPASLIVSSPNSVAGSALVRATTEFWGVDANGLLNLYRTSPGECRMWQLNLLAGYRFLELDEGLRLSSRSTVLTGNVPAGGVVVPSPTTVEVRDQFDTTNRFHGGQVGLESQFTSGRWYVGVTGKVAFGGVSQRLIVDGATGTINPATSRNSTTLGGLYANASNIGRYRNDDFAIVTDVNATLGFHFTSWLIGTVGYNFIHLSDAARPGNAFSGTVDPTLVPTSAQFGTAGAANFGRVVVRRDDYFTHGLNFGFIVKY